MVKGRGIFVCIGLYAVTGAVASTWAQSPTEAPLPRAGTKPHYFSEANWANSPPLRKFVDSLPGLGAGNANNLGQYIPVAVADQNTYQGSDYYEIGLVEYREQLHSDLPALSPLGVSKTDPAATGGTKLRGYVQLNGGDPTPHYLGPLIIAQRNRPVRIKFVNMLPTGMNGDLFVPVDPTVMGAGMGPNSWSWDAMMSMFMPNGNTEMYTQNRATLHLHGGRNPWISDGTAHQWTAPVGEVTSYPKGVSVQNVPDMPDPGPGSITFYWTNQQSARLMFFHDHAFGITRLNVYVGEAAGFLLQDDYEKDMVNGTNVTGINPSLVKAVPAEQIPLVIQDKTFVDAGSLPRTDPTWNWGSKPGFAVTGDLWYPHVYMPAQNPGDPSGMNAFGRWHYGPWFWPPTTNITNGPVKNPFYPTGYPVAGSNKWTPEEPEWYPGVPDVSMAGEAFMDTMLVNGTAYPHLDVEPKAYRFRILNAADDRFLNLSLFVADPNVVMAGGQTEVKMVPAYNYSLTDATWPSNWPTDGREGGVPDWKTTGPSFIQIGNESGVLPAPAEIAPQPVTWNYNPTAFNFGNVLDHSLLLGCAERADVIVDFSAYAGQTLILYNDAPAAFPALVPQYDYYTGAPDRTAVGGAPAIPAGVGPNVRTVMQIRVAAARTDGQPIAAYDVTPLNTLLPAAFAASQEKLLVPNAVHNAVYGGNFPADTYTRIYDSSKTFQTVDGGTATIPFEHKALHDEMGAAFETEYGRMSGKLGVELPVTNAQNQNFILQSFIDPPTEVLTNTPDLAIPIGSLGDGTQIWKVTHNGVDTHPIHFHLMDVQLINRVAWDNAVLPPDPNEIGWKETVRMNPLEDCIVAMRPQAPTLPWLQPASIRPLDPTMPLGSTMGFANIDPITGQALATPTTNQLQDFGWEYTWHCHILAHEEMDMMRPMSFIGPVVGEASPPSAPSSLVATVVGPPLHVDLNWVDTSNNERGFTIERAPVSATGVIGTFVALTPDLAANQAGGTDSAVAPSQRYAYRVSAFNNAGYSGTSNVVVVTTPAPLAGTAPTSLTATASTLSTSAPTITLRWNDRTTNEAGFIIERALVLNGVVGAYAQVGAVGANVRTWVDTTVVPLAVYSYRVAAYNQTGYSAYSNLVNATSAGQLPLAPTALTAVGAATPTVSVTLTWTDNATNETGYTVQRSTSSNFGQNRVAFTLPANSTSYVDTAALTGVRYYYRVFATNPSGSSAYSQTVNLTIAPPVVIPAAPTNLVFVSSTNSSVTISWTDNANNEQGFRIQRSTAGTNGPWTTIATSSANVATYTNTGLKRTTTYWYRVAAYAGTQTSAYTNVVSGKTK